MEAAFWHYEPVTAGQEDELWERATVVLDTNCLLHLYRYTPTTRRWFIEALETLKSKGQLWIPHHVGEEFYRNRPLVALDTRKKLIQTKDLVEAAEKHLNSLVQHKDDVADLLSAFNSLKQQIVQAVEHISAAGPKDPLPQHDAILKEIKKLFDSDEMIGEEYSQGALERVYEQGRERYANLIPPGYEDARTKPEPSRYGDLVIWKQLLDHFTELEQPCIFVTGDVKPDWWIRLGSRKGAKVVHPHLRSEFKEATKNVIWLYDRDDFLRETKRRSVPDIPDESIEEVKLSQESQEHGIDMGSSGWAALYKQARDVRRGLEVISELTGVQGAPYRAAVGAFEGYFRDSSAIASAMNIVPSVEDWVKLQGITPSYMTESPRIKTQLIAPNQYFTAFHQSSSEGDSSDESIDTLSITEDSHKSDEGTEQ